MTARLNRRRAVQAMAAGVLAAGARGALPAWGLPAPNDLAPPDALLERVGGMAALGPRLPGSIAHARFVDDLDARFVEAGLTIQRDRFTFTRWTAEAWSLEVLHPRAEPDRIPVASAYTYSGATGPDGVTGQLVDLGRPGAQTLVRGLRGAVVLFDAPAAPIRGAALRAARDGGWDPDGQIRGRDNYTRAWITGMAAAPLAPFRRAGAIAAIVVLDASAANAAGQYVPFIHPLQGLPALIVDRDTGARLRARRGASIRLTLRARVDPGTSTDSLLAVLPGASAETILVHTHTDGPNAVEENGGIALAELARWASRRSWHRTLAFSAVTGHFGPGLPETRGLLHRHPEMRRRAVASLTLEHLGAREWIDDDGGYHPTGRPEIGVAFHSLTGIRGSLQASLRESDLRRTVMLPPAGPRFFGVGADLHAAGIPSAAYITGPNYLLSDVPGGHLDKFDPHRMRAEITWAAALLNRLDRIEAWKLRAGDSLLLRGR